VKTFVISVYKSVFEDVKMQPSKNVVKRCNKKEMMSIMLSRRIQLHFHFMYFIPIEFSNAKKIPYTMFSYYQNEISNLDMQLNIDVLTRLIWSPSLIRKWANRYTDQRHQMITTSCMVCLLKYGLNQSYKIEQERKKRTFVNGIQNSNPHHPQYYKHIFVHELVCDFMPKNIAFNEFYFISNIHLKCKTAQHLIRSNASSDDFKIKKRF